MRHIRSKRRFKVLLAALLAVCLLLVFETRIESFMPHLKGLAEVRAEEMLGNRIRLSIGSIDGGIVHPLTFNDIKMKDKKDAPLVPSLVIDRVKTSYRLWDLFLNNKDQAFVTNSLPRDSCIYVNFTTKNRDLSGFVRLEGDLLNSKIKGYLLFFDKEKIEFSGVVQQDSFDLDIWLPKGALRAEGSITGDGILSVKIKASHVRLYDFDITCEANLKNKIVRTPRDSKWRLEGELETKNLILNYKPFLDFKTSYIISDSKLEIPDLNIGDSIKVSGEAALKKPYNMRVVLTANNVNLSWLLFRLGFEEARSVISGTLNGKFEAKGPIKNLKASSHFEIKKGTIGTVDFDFLSASLKGDLPFVRIEDSRITRPSGYFVLAGEMDLRRLGKNNLFDNIRMVTDDNAINWDGLDTANLQYTQEIRMQKKLNEDINFDYKKIVDKDKIDESLRDHDEAQFEYKLHPNDSLKMTVGQDGGFLGVEHKDKF